MPYDDEIVDNGFQSPHRYGSTITDIFQPRPSNEKELQKNLFASGYLGDVPREIHPGRSPFGQLLQGVGILGEPEARPLTPYEQMLVEEGRHERSGEDYLTEKQRMDRLQSQINLAQDVISSGGGVPAEEMGIPDFMQQNVRNMYSAYNQEQGVKSRHDELVMQAQEADIAYKKAMTDQADFQKKAINEAREWQIMGELARLPQIQPIYKQYENVRQQVTEALDRGDKNAAAVGMELLNRIKRTLHGALISAGADKYVNRMLPNTADIFDPFTQPGANRNILQSPADVDRGLEEVSGWEIREPQPTGTVPMQPTPTPGMYAPNRRP